MATVDNLAQQIKDRFSNIVEACDVANQEVTVEVPAEHLREVCLILRDEPFFKFNLLIDVCGVDYLDYGVMEWATDSTSTTGFSRGVEKGESKERTLEWNKPRYAVVYHLLSLEHNHRMRLRAFPEGEPPLIDSVIDIWNAASWFEREAFDMFGILFKDHPDLRRILTDYGFVGHPFRKDFPLSGHVEMRYDAKQGRVVYEPVDIEPRVLVPKVNRDDNRYAKAEEVEHG